MRRLGPAIWLAGCLLIPSALFLARYVVDGTGVAPAGSDTSQHVWRSQVVAELGLEALPPFEGRSQALQTNADRPGLPLILAILSSITGADAGELAYVLPAVAAAAIAMAAAALAGTVAGVPWWGIGLAGVATGASVQVAFAANGYLDQLLVEPLALAAAAGALRAAGGGRGGVLGSVALLAAWLVHWQFALLTTGLLALLALACVPGSVRHLRAGGSLAETASGRVGATAVGGAALGAAALVLGTPGVPRVPSGLSRGSVERHLAEQAHRYRLPVAAPAALLGAAWLVGGRGDPSRSRAAWLLVPWALLPAVAAAAHAAGGTVPLQRSLSFALAIPLLGALGLVGASVWSGRRLGSPWGAAAAVLAAAALAVSTGLAWDAWRTRRPWSEDRRLAEFQALGDYLAGAGRPAIVVVDGRPGAESGAERHFGTVPVMRRIRAELPARLALRTTVYLGDPDRLVAGAPTRRPDVPGFDEISRETWRAAAPLLALDPTIVVLRSQFVGFAASVRAHPAWRSHGWVAIVSGPDPPAALDRPVPRGRPGPGALAVRWGICLAVLTLAGAGWSARFGDGPLSQRLALAPAAGLAVLVPVCLVLERAGVRVGGDAALVVAGGVALAGAIAAASAPSFPPRALAP